MKRAKRSRSEEEIARRQACRPKSSCHLAEELTEPLYEPTDNHRSGRLPPLRWLPLQRLNHREAVPVPHNRSTRADVQKQKACRSPRKRSFKKEGPPCESPDARPLARGSELCLAADSFIGSACWLPALFG